MSGVVYDTRERDRSVSKPVSGGARAATSVETAPVDAGTRAVDGMMSDGAAGEPRAASVPMELAQALEVFAALEPSQAQDLATVLMGWVEQLDSSGAGSVVDQSFAVKDFERYDVDLLGQAYQALAEAGVIKGIKLDVGADVEQQLGPVVGKAKAALEVFTGVFGHARAAGFVERGNFFWDIAASGHLKASLFVGTAAEGEVGLSAAFGSTQVDAFAQGELMAGARVAGEGTIALSANRVVLDAEAVAFAGVKADGSVGGSTKLFGRTVFGVKATGSVGAGVGGDASFKFKAGGGKLTVAGSTFASLGLGLGGGGEGQADLNPLKVYVWRALSRMSDRAGMKDHINTGAVLTDSASPLRAALLGYSERKWQLVRTGRADNYVKAEKVQAFIDEHINRTTLKEHRISTYDRLIEELVESTLRGPDGAVKVKASVQHGKVMGLEEHPKDAIDKIKRHWAGEVSGLTPER